MPETTIRLLRWIIGLIILGFVVFAITNLDGASDRMSDCQDASRTYGDSNQDLLDDDPTWPSDRELDRRDRALEEACDD